VFALDTVSTEKDNMLVLQGLKRTSIKLRAKITVFIVPGWLNCCAEKPHFRFFRFSEIEYVSH
jgi:hypothetical protein